MENLLGERDSLAFGGANIGMIGNQNRPRRRRIGRSRAWTNGHVGDLGEVGVEGDADDGRTRKFLRTRLEVIRPIDFVLHTQLMDAGPSHATIGPNSVLVLHTQLLDTGPSHAAIGPISVLVLHTQLLDTGPSHAAIGPISVLVLHTQLLDTGPSHAAIGPISVLVLHTQLLDTGPSHAAIGPQIRVVLHTPL
ncbi:hypothetical protein LR48_Vigan02g135200 [Vigna angularis]|uniref:Uncharacterized protein n=1 Tax=Phaseolus angularis TaxID=3914 RepID=A0A0L9TXS5_PHAAN|nr:hypothetical protein LR48_Vigan02g135200 [Vigna angularis]